jgi:hypothetical protein
LDIFTVGDRPIYGTNCRVFAATLTSETWRFKPLLWWVMQERHMNALMRRTARGVSVDSEKPAKAGTGFFAIGLGNGLEAAFAVCVLLGALWLLISGYA